MLLIRLVMCFLSLSGLFVGKGIVKQLRTRVSGQVGDGRIHEGDGTEGDGTLWLRQLSFRAG